MIRVLDVIGTTIESNDATSHIPTQLDTASTRNLYALLRKQKRRISSAEEVGKPCPAQLCPCPRQEVQENENFFTVCLTVN